MRKILITTVAFVAITGSAVASESAQTQTLADHFVGIGEMVCAKQATPAACEVQFNGLAIQLYIEPSLGENSLLQEFVELVAKYAANE